MQDVCLFAHFDNGGQVDEYVLRYLKILQELDYSIVFITASPLVQPEIERLHTCCYDVILRENSGLDFASWSAGFAKHGPEINGRLLLANDSVYGPVGSLRSAIEQLTKSRADFYGMVESVEVAPHLQSWFLLLEPWVVRDPEFRAILAQPFSTMSRREIVLNGELGLSRHLLNAGFRYEALGRLDCLPRRYDANPMLLFWHELLCEKGVPFLKIELLRDNPIGVEDVNTILKSIESIDPFICSLIRSHLARITGNKPIRPPRSRFAQVRYALIREYFYGRRDKNRLPAGWALIKLETLTALLVAWRSLRRLFGVR